MAGPDETSARQRGAQGPYRAGEGRAPEVAAAEDGIVDELIQQFADPLAFYRELVQNSIDAGATRIAVTLGWDPDSGGDASEGGAPDDGAPGTTRVRVSDDGCGMSRDVLENQLTVLFRSGKEGQEGKIGKFGVGFVSVLALEPSEVRVRTSEGDGALWTLVLRADQTYELFHAQGGGEAGTSVTLEIPQTRGAFAALVEGSERALHTWCRHAELPIQLVASLPDGGLHEVRVDRPFGVDALVQVRVQDGSTRVAAGLTDAPGGYVAFFNRGLLLHETRRPLFGEVRVKILDGTLEHTLSRDNVRRDARYERAMRVARRAVDGELRAELRRRLAAAGGSGAPLEGGPRIDQLLEVALRSELDVDLDRLPLPLTDPVRGGGRWTLRRLAREAYATEAPSALTEALGRRGVPCVDLRVAAAPARYMSLLERAFGRAVERPEQSASLAVAVAPSGVDAALLDGVAAILADCARRPSDLRFAVLQGRRADELALAVEVDPRGVAIREDDLGADPFRFFARPPLALNVEHSLVARAREAAAERPALAASLLARALLLTWGRLDEGADDAWVARALREVGA